MNDLLFSLLGTCEFGIVFVSVFVALVVYVFLSSNGVPRLCAIVGGVVTFFVCLRFFLVMC